MPSYIIAVHVVRVLQQMLLARELLNFGSIKMRELGYTFKPGGVYRGSTDLQLLEPLPHSAYDLTSDADYLKVTCSPRD